MVSTGSAYLGYYHPELFNDLSGTADTLGWLRSEIETEAWLIDTISALSDHFLDAVLVGGSGVRNHTKQNRLTNDVDFDTKLKSLREVNEQMAVINKRLVGTRNPKEGQIGAITHDKLESSRAKFYGVRKLVAYNRWRSSERAVRIHIMYVPDDMQFTEIHAHYQFGHPYNIIIPPGLPQNIIYSIEKQSVLPMR